MRFSRPDELTETVVDPASRAVRVEVGRSGTVHWDYGAGGGGDGALYAVSAAVIANVLSHWLVWRRGWKIDVSVEDHRVWRQRFPDRTAALEALPAVRAALTADGISALERASA